MSNALRKIRRNASEVKTGTRDHNMPYKIAKRKREESAEKQRREQEKIDKNLGNS